LLRAFKGGKGGVAAPSANKFGHVPTTAQHVRDEFGPDHTIAASSTAARARSHRIDHPRPVATRQSWPVLLRPGHISVTDIAAVIGRMPAQPDAAAPRASGTLEAITRARRRWSRRRNWRRRWRSCNGPAGALH